MPDKYELAQTDEVRLLKGSFKIVSHTGDVEVGYKTGRNFAKAIIFLGDIDLRGDIPQQIYERIIRNGVFFQRWEPDQQPAVTNAAEATNA